MDDLQKAKTRPKKRKRGMTFCPKCGSTDIYYASGLAQLWSIWECRTCGYRGAFILEDGKTAQKLQEIHMEKAAKHQN